MCAPGAAHTASVTVQPDCGAACLHLWLLLLLLLFMPLLLLFMPLLLLFMHLLLARACTRSSGTWKQRSTTTATGVKSGAGAWVLLRPPLVFRLGHVVLIIAGAARCCGRVHGRIRGGADGREEVAVGACAAAAACACERETASVKLCAALLAGVDFPGGCWC